MNKFFVETKKVWFSLIIDLIFFVLWERTLNYFWPSTKMGNLIYYVAITILLARKTIKRLNVHYRGIMVSEERVRSIIEFPNIDNLATNLAKVWEADYFETSIKKPNLFRSYYVHTIKIYKKL